MYDSLTFYLYENQFKLKSERFFDGYRTKKIDGKFDIRARFVNGLKERIRRDKRYYPLIDLTEPVIGSVKTGKRKVNRLEIQTSFPKSCFGTSKYEIGFEDFDLAIKKNLEYLKMADVITDTEKLKNGISAEIAFTKSMIIPSYFGLAEQIVRKLFIFNQKQRSDFRWRDYNDGSEGVSFNFHNNIRGLCGYCKYSEIVSSGYTLEEEEEKRRVLMGEQTRDTFRIELSLNKKQTLEAVLRRFIPNKKRDFTLNDIFTNGNISQKILLEEFDTTFSPLNVALISMAEMKDNQLEYMLKSKKLSFKERALLYYMVNIAVKFGLNQLWRQLKEEMSDSSYHKTRKEVQEIIRKLDEFKEPTANLVEFLRNELVKFEPIKPVVPKTSCQPLLIKI